MYWWLECEAGTRQKQRRKERAIFNDFFQKKEIFCIFFQCLDLRYQRGGGVLMTIDDNKSPSRILNTKMFVESISTL